MKKIFTIIMLLFTGTLNAQDVNIPGGYNGRGYVPGYKFDARTGWARVGNFNFRPSSGYTSPFLPTPPINRGGYPNSSPRVYYNYGRPILINPIFRPIPPGGWYNNDSDNWGR